MAVNFGRHFFIGIFRQNNFGYLTSTVYLYYS